MPTRALARARLGLQLVRGRQVTSIRIVWYQPHTTMTVQAALKSQYHAGLSMLLSSIEACPPPLWIDASYVNPFWQVAYHALFYTDQYLRASEAAFVPWEKHRPEYHRFGHDRDDATDLVPYSPADIRAYCLRCQGVVDDAVDELDLTAAESGFSWYPIPKLEHQFVNLRHLQHHTGQLTDRLRQFAGVGVAWRGSHEVR